MLGDTIEKVVGTEKHWVKVEVELDETDLTRLLVEAGYDRGMNLGLALEGISSRDVFNLLVTETEILVGAALVMQNGITPAEYQEARARLEARKEKALAKIKSKHG
jgi:hypothetical protein